ncbi:hypothetical protein GQ53DRAFT_751453 [Thozetella sp. PMI_491]|nr:hypothetical protein GQ53DRAFT_751453 [Thozetella sp. PMI_491]
MPSWLGSLARAAMLQSLGLYNGRLSRSQRGGTAPDGKAKSWPVLALGLTTTLGVCTDPVTEADKRPVKLDFIGLPLASRPWLASFPVGRWHALRVQRPGMLRLGA